MTAGTVTVVHTIAEVREWVDGARRAGCSVGFVPTMGALHEGHADLIRASVTEQDVTIVSIFVNPLQFGPNEDLDRYPRTLAEDTEVVAACGADLIFAPSASEMYPGEQLTFIDVEGITAGLCGASRPGHFRGVATVVAKLFNIVQPDVAYFGQKDAQQVAVIERMVRDLAMPIRIVRCPTAREADGLAISSRNRYLSAEERQAAAVLYKALQAGATAIQAGQREADKVRRVMADHLRSEPLARVDYIEIVDEDTFEAISYVNENIVLVGAILIGNTRLIDNLPLVVPEA